MHREWKWSVPGQFCKRLRSVSLPDPGHRFVGEFVERRYGELDVLFLGVLDPVVADAAEALYEHHDRRDAGPGDFGGVVQRAGRNAMRLGSDVTDGVIAEINQLIVK